MRVKQFIKSLNNTELGKGGTHECYVLVSTKVDGINKIFDEQNYHPTFINLKNGGTVDSIHISNGREFRINGLGDFYRENNANAGDEIIFERRDYGNSTVFTINIITKNSSIIFQKNRRGFEVLNRDRLDNLLVNNMVQTNAIYNGVSGNLLISYKESARKRADSPSETDFFSMTFNDIDILNDLRSNEYFELSEENSNRLLKKVVVWQSYEFNIE